jgi:hypothetical protein
MKRGITHKLMDWERQSILDAHQAQEKAEAISAEFGVSPSYPALLARRHGLKVRPRGRPSKNAQLARPMLAV